MKRILLVFLLFCAPLSAEEHLRSVYGRENQRLNILLKWSPGDSRPTLPPLLKFDPKKHEPPAAPVSEPPKASIVKPKVWSGARTTDYAPWIVQYSKSISLREADLISRTIQRFARKHNIDPKLVVALVAAESAFRRDARSPVGAQGLGQLMPGTAAMLGISRPYDPEQNLDGTVRYLSTQLKRWGSPALALASYNAGPGAVSRYGGIPPYRETQEYVRYVLKLHGQIKSLETQQRAVTKRNQRSES